MPCQRLIEEPLSLGIKTISSTLHFIRRRLKQRMIVFPQRFGQANRIRNISWLFFQVFFSLRRTEVVVVQGSHRIPFKVRMPTLKSGPFSTTPAHQNGDTATARLSRENNQKNRCLDIDVTFESSSPEMTRNITFYTTPAFFGFKNWFLFGMCNIHSLIWWNKCCSNKNC